MPDISASFKSDYSESRLWTIWDTGRDPNSPPVLFNDYLGPNDVTAPLVIYSEDGLSGKILYKRTDGAPTVVDNVWADSTVSMD